MGDALWVNRSAVAFLMPKASKKITLKTTLVSGGRGTPQKSSKMGVSVGKSHQ
jgi:hypothetical protein